MTQAQLQPNSLEAKALQAKWGDLESYAKAVHRMQIEPYQLVWEEALLTSDRTVIVCPPDTYKSTTVQFFIEQMIGKNPWMRFLWIMNTGTQSARRVSEIGRTITSNPVYKKAFGVRPDPNAPWTQTSLYVDRPDSHPDPTLFGSGWDGPYQGLHCHIVILDDLTDQDDVRSAVTMDMQRAKLRGVIVDRLEDGGRIIALMTRWGEMDLLPTFLEMGFRVIVMPLIADYPWGPTISNRRFPLESIANIRRDKGDYLFNLTFMCDAQAATGGIIKRDSISYWDEGNLPESATFTLMSVDPARSTDIIRDPSCIATGILEPKTRRLYQTELLTAHMDGVDLEDEIVKRAKRTSGLIAIGVETVGYQATLFQSLRRRHGLPVVELPYRTRRNMALKTQGLDRDKEGRAMYLDYKLRRGELLLARTNPLSQGVSLETELVSFPGGKHDDRMDALAFLCALADSYAPTAAPAIKFSAFKRLTRGR